MKILKIRKKIKVSTKNKNKKVDLFPLKNSIIPKSTKIIMIAKIITIKAQNATTMKKNMIKSPLIKIMMILILKNFNKITDCPLLDILQKVSSEVHQSIQEEVQLDSEAIFHLKD